MEVSSSKYIAIKGMDFHSQANLVQLVAGQPFVASFFSYITEPLYIYSQVCCKNLIVKIITKADVTGTFYVLELF